MLKRTLRRLLVAIATFVIGTASHWVFDGHREVPPGPQSELVRVDFQNRNDAEVVFDYDSTQFNPRGDYFILGRKPKEFREFDCLELGIDDDSNGKVSGQVMISTYAEQTYDAIYATSGLVNNQRISRLCTKSRLTSPLRLRRPM